jgi:hypothetical protein
VRFPSLLLRLRLLLHLPRGQLLLLTRAFVSCRFFFLFFCFFFFYYYSPDPIWASINLGIFICIKCAGVHRNMGVHVSQVRSVTMDKWDPDVLDVRAFALSSTSCSTTFVFFFYITTYTPLLLSFFL